MPPLTERPDTTGQAGPKNQMRTPDVTSSLLPLAPPPLAPVPLAPGLDLMRHSRDSGDISDTLQLQPGLSLHADPALGIGGRYRSPAGRLLELDVTTTGTDGQITLHISLEAANLTTFAYIGLACRCAALKELAVRACLRSGTDDGFVDCPFDKHILALPAPLNHVDARHIQTHRALPETAPWRELVLFLPSQSFRWDLHDLRLFLI